VAPFVWVTGFHDLVSGTSFRCFLGGVWDFFTSSNLAQLHKCRAKHLNFSNSASQKKGDVDPNFSVFMNQEKRCFTIPILSFLMKLRGNYPPMPSITQKKTVCSFSFHSSCAPLLTPSPSSQLARWPLCSTFPVTVSSPQPPSGVPPASAWTGELDPLVRGCRKRGGH
jgi:hypothetical protein